MHGAQNKSAATLIVGIIIGAVVAGLIVYIAMSKKVAAEQGRADVAESLFQACSNEFQPPAGLPKPN